jgi:hypothetical protein
MQPKNVRAKFLCTNIAGTQVSLSAVVGSTGENASWSAATPSGSITMNISNPDALERFTQGAEYYIDFTPAD